MADTAEPIIPMVLGFELLAVVVVGVVLAIVQMPQDKRSPSKMMQVQTKLGVKPLHEVIAPNVIPALTTCLVAIPLSLALGIATGTSPMTGIATAVIGGVVSGCFGSSAFNVVGPAGALVGILMRYTHTYGPGILPWLSLISACLIALTCLLRLHEYCMFMPKAVFEGFTVSVALCIGLGQMDFAFGLTSGPPLKVKGLELSPAIFKFATSCKAFGTIQASTAVLFLGSMLLLTLLYKWKATVPWMVPYAAVACLLGALCDEQALGLIDLDIPTLRSKYGIISFWVATGTKPLTQLVSEAAERGKGSYGDIFMGGISVSIVAILETLISAKIAQTRSRMAFNADQELQGLALSHAACGFCGVMPPTGVFVRTNVNFATGATHRTSQLMQGLFVLLFASVCMPLLSYLPQGSVAAILVTASIRMVPWSYILQLWEEQKWYFCLLWVVALVCWLIDSVTGLAVGTMVALLVTGKETARGHAEISITAADHERLKNGVPKMIAIDALDVDDVDLGVKKPQSDSEEETGTESDEEHSITNGNAYSEVQRETKDFNQADKARDLQSYSHLAYAPEWGKFERQWTPEGSGFDRQVSETPNLFKNGADEALRPSARGDRVFLYKFLGQLDFLCGDKHVERFQTMLASGPKCVVISLQNVPWVDPDGMEALRGMMAMLDENHVQAYLASPRPKVVQKLALETWYREKKKKTKTTGQEFEFPTVESALIAAVGSANRPGMGFLGA